MKYLPRHIESKIRDFLEVFKVVLITGARQVGKSSTLKNIFPERRYVVFDGVQDIYGARKDSDLFLDNFPTPLILDEIQYVPELLGAIKRRVDILDAKGQYIMTGSQNLAMMKNVSESLAGRVGIIQMYPMTSMELLGKGKHKYNWLDEYLKCPESFGESLKNLSLNSSLPNLIWRGTMPGLIEMEDAYVHEYFKSYVQTYVDRDIRLLENIKDLTDFGIFIRLSANLTAQEINSSQLGREIGVNPKTARNWLDLLTHTFQWFELPPYHGNTLKRLSRKRKGYFSDTGLASYLMGISSPENLAGSPSFGRLFESYAVSSAMKHAARLNSGVNFYHWRSASGAEVDLLIEWNGQFYPVEIKLKSSVDSFDARGIRAFKETYPKLKVMPGLIFCSCPENYKVNEYVSAVSYKYL